jgi:apolipoprotein N-acyltransferase
MLYLGATALAAALTWMAFPPLGWGFMALIGPAPFLWSLRKVELPRQAAGLGFLYGIVLWGALLWWIWNVGLVAYVPLITAFGVYAAGYGLLVWLARNLAPWRWWLVAVGGWALWDFLRARYPFGGFPWGTIGYGLGQLPWPRGATQWIGASGLGVLAIAVAAGLVLVVEDRRNTAFLAYPAAVLVAFSLAGWIWMPEANGPTWQVAIVQGGSPCPGSECPDEKQLIYQSHLALTRTLPPDTYDLVVWGENSVGGRFEPTSNPEVAIQLSSEAQRLNSYLMISGTRGDGPDAFINANLLISPEGQAIGEYRKRHPVPFGEYVPLREYIDWIPQLEQVPRDMVRGDRPVVFETSEGTIGSVISFEGAFAREIRAVAKLGAQLLTVNTNESSFGVSPASDQLIGMVRVWAAENGIEVAVAAITGKSALIAADGTIKGTSDLFTEGILVGELNWRSGGRTVYTRYGDWLQVLMFLGIPIALLIGREKHKPEYIFASTSRQSRIR